mgnify:FL=1
MSSKKRKKSDTLLQASHESACDRLRELVTPGYDHTQIDLMLAQVRTDMEKDTDSNTEMVCCPRVYEESYLREAVGAERSCIRGPGCEGLSLLVDDPFTVREFIYPGKEHQAADPRALCLLCRRNEIAAAYYRYETGNAKSFDCMRLADHFNLVGVPGEYDVRDCIVSSGKHTGIPLPVVLHVRSAYASYVRDGIKCLSQKRMRYPDGPGTEEGSFLGRRAALVKKAAPSSPHSVL